MERTRVQVVYNFGSVVTVGVYKDNNTTWQEAVKNYSEDIEGFINPETGKYEEITNQEEEREGETMRTQEEIKKDIITYFEENEEEYNEVIEELDGYNGKLGDDRYYDMDMFDELLTGLTPMEVLQRTYYGGDDDTKDERGIRGEFNPNRSYFYYNGYGNLCSTDYKDYTDHLDNYFVDDLIDYAGQLWNIPDEVKELLDELDKAEEE